MKIQVLLRGLEEITKAFMELCFGSGATRYVFFVTRYGTRYSAKIVTRYRYSYLRLESNSVLYGTRYGTFMYIFFQKNL